MTGHGVLKYHFLLFINPTHATTPLPVPVCAGRLRQTGEPPPRFRLFGDRFVKGEYKEKIGTG